MQLQRHPANPILTPNPQQDWEAGAVFNCGVTIGPDGLFYMLYRAIGRDYRPNPVGYGYINYISRIGLAVSEDGVHFERQPEPVLQPDTAADRWGCEDPRITRLDVDGQPTWWVTYTALSAPAFSGQGDRVGIASSRDCRTFHKHGVLIPDVQDKDAVIFPALVQGQVVVLHRVEPDIQIAFLPGVDALSHPDHTFWRDHLAHIEEHVLLRPHFPWEAKKIGAGPPPILTEAGWVLIYHGVSPDKVYRTGVALLDRDDPRRVIARLPEPILEPEMPYEREGDIPNVVFPTGAVVRDDTLYVYYGAADKVCALATVPLAALLEALLRHPWPAD